MSLYQKLQEAKSEEDVKDIYIKALGLKGVSRNLIDIRIKEIWFEVKKGSKESIYAMFTQLFHYVQDALTKGEYVPPFLAVIDSIKATIMKTADVIPFLQQKTIQWGKSASDYTQDAIDAKLIWTEVVHKDRLAQERKKENPEKVWTGWYWL